MSAVKITDPHFVFGIERDVYKRQLLGYVLLDFAACAACYGACRWLSPDNTILSLLLRCVIVGVIYPGIWLGVTGRTAEWKQLWGILLRFLHKGKKAE